MDLDMS